MIQHEEWTGTSVNLEVYDLPDDVPLAVKMATYRIVQEALSNAYHHAEIEDYWVRLWGEVDAIHLEVVDQGRGFDPPNLDDPDEAERADHIGLRGMYDRVQLLGGRFTLTSRPGAGTHIHVTIPIVAPTLAVDTGDR